MAPRSSKRSKQEFLGYGKLIIFGEHFVVHNQRPSLVGALQAYSTCTVDICPENEWSCGLVVLDNRVAVPGYKDEKKDEMLESCKLVLKVFGIDPASRGVKISFAGELCAVSGVGASAASCVALARALNDALGKNMTEEEINAAAFEGEKGYHGTPSGIDNTCSTYGGLLKFQRSAVEGGSPTFETLSLSKPILLVYASTGITSSTTAVVSDVKKRKEENPAWYLDLQTKYDALYEKGYNAVMASDAKTVGECCDENQVLLRELGVSCPELEALIEEAKKAGALGAKLAGTGRGGLMFAICDSPKMQKQVMAALSTLAKQVWMTKFQ